MPTAESGSNTNLWYSYNVGPMHYIAISTVLELLFDYSIDGGDLISDSLLSISLTGTSAEGRFTSACLA